MMEWKHNNLIQNLKKWKTTRNQLSQKASAKTSKYIIELILFRLLETGKYPEKVKTGWFLFTNASGGERFRYSGLWANEKGYSIPADLHYTGEFYNSFKTKLDKSGITTEANFIKEEGHIGIHFTKQVPNLKEFERLILSMSDDEFEIWLNKYFLVYFNIELKNLLDV